MYFKYHFSNDLMEDVYSFCAGSSREPITLQIDVHWPYSCSFNGLYEASPLALLQ